MATSCRAPPDRQLQIYNISNMHAYAYASPSRRQLARTFVQNASVRIPRRLSTNFHIHFAAGNAGEKTHKKRNVYNPSSGLAGCTLKVVCASVLLFATAYLLAHMYNECMHVLESPSNCANKHPNTALIMMAYMCVCTTKKNTGRRYFNGSVPLCTFLCMRFFRNVFFRDCYLSNYHFCTT